MKNTVAEALRALFFTLLFALEQWALKGRRFAVSLDPHPDQQANDDAAQERCKDDERNTPAGQALCCGVRFRC